MLYRPPLNDTTVWLWGGPVLLLSLGLGALAWQLLRHLPDEGDPT
ncbi:cytochrome c-type biogenesis protein CcmH [Acinetobacter baumannii]